MPITTGERLGPYEIVSPIGSGGMGEVYRARDTRLDRTVAVKILRTALSADVGLRSRFEREAQVVSALDHPHICPLYDVGEHNGMHFLVMPCLEGQTLADRLGAGPLPLKQALQIAVQIADGLDAAHRAAVVHRDLKPGNIMLTQSGAKLLDFGLAKLSPDVSGDVQDQTRLAGTATISGTVLGTTPYMAPEQIEGRTVDARSDIFALGIVLHEMLTGRRPFGGDTPASVMSAILRDEPVRVTASQPALPAALDYVVGTCLAKNPDQRWQNARDVALALKGIDETKASYHSQPEDWFHKRRERIAWCTAGLLAIAAGLAVWSPWRQPPAVTEGARARFTIASPGKPGDDTVSVSPDGRRLAFAAAGPDGNAILWIRELDVTTLRSLPGTEEVTQHFWSPDAAWIAFFAQGKLKKVNLTTGAVETLCNATNPRGGTWGADDTIILATTGQGLFAVPASGGEPRPLTTLDAGRTDRSHRWPVFLPDGRHFLFINRSGNPDNAGVYLGSTGSTTTTRLVASASNAAYAAPGYLMFIRGGTFYAQAFDLRSLKIHGEAQAAQEQIRFEPGAGQADFSVSTNGVLAYRSGEGVEYRLNWIDRRGNRLGAIGPTVRHANLALSPDGKRIAATRFAGQTGSGDLWLIDAASGAESRLTFESSGESQPVWSPDGQWIAFGSDRSGFLDLYRKRASGGQEELLLTSPIVKYASSWSVDNRHLVFEADEARTKLDIWMLPLSGDRRPVPLLQTAADEWDGRLSPDGKWLAYTSNESGRYEVYVQTFPLTGAKWQVSTNGGLHPRWRADGKELFYVTATQKLAAVTVDLAGQFSAVRREELFELRIANIFTVRSPYAVSSDGQRFVTDTARTDVIPPVHVVLNWASGLPR